jgi:hypothetical protein
MESKMDFETLDDQNFLISLQIWLDYCSFARTHDAIFPSLVNELKVTGIFAKRADSPRLYVSELLSKVRVDR